MSENKETRMRLFPDGTLSQEKRFAELCDFAATLSKELLDKIFHDDMDMASAGVCLEMLARETLMVAVNVACYLHKVEAEQTKTDYHKLSKRLNAYYIRELNKYKKEILQKVKDCGVQKEFH